MVARLSSAGPSRAAAEGGGRLRVGIPFRRPGSLRLLVSACLVFAHPDLEEQEQERASQPQRYERDSQHLPGHSTEKRGAHRSGDDKQRRCSERDDPYRWGHTGRSSARSSPASSMNPYG